MTGDTPLTGGKYRHLALIAETAADGRDVLVGDSKAPSDTSAGSGILQVHPPAFLPHYEPSKRRLTWPNGATATVYNATEPEALRGPQHDGAVCDELAKWMYAQETWDQLQFGLRTGEHPRVLISTTPRPTKLLKQIIADLGTVVTRGSTLDNRSNLAPQFVANILRKYEGTRLGRQELFAEILEDMEGALFLRSNIDANRRKLAEVPVLKRIVIAIDPALSVSEESDETGIIAAGLGIDGRGYILDDISGRYSPSEWAREAISLYHARMADRVVGERNAGGDMIESTLRQVDPSVSYRSVWASKRKFVRAEPVSALYEQNRISHVGAFHVLEDQMCSFVADADRKTLGYSPDRADALVYALTELMIDGAEERRLLFTSIPLVGRPRSYY